jgi:quercetin dioxygenase-like cupin family protein
MIKAYQLFTGPDGNAHVRVGTVREHERNEVVAIHFKESPPHSTYDWHTAPEMQYVITLRGTLEFTVRDGSTFILRPGEVLLAEDTTGSAHKWRSLGDEPWQRAYVVLKPGAADLFVEDPA